MKYIALKDSKWSIDPPFPGELELVKGEIIDIDNPGLVSRMLNAGGYIEEMIESRPEDVGNLGPKIADVKPKLTRKRRK